MAANKTQIIQDIESARTHLERALDELVELPVPADGAAEVARRTLGSYLVLAKGTVELLREELRDYPVRDVHVWVNGLARGTDLMQQLIEQIRSGKVAQEKPKWEEVEIATVMRRQSQFHQEIAARRGIDLEFDAAVSTSRAWTDRIIAGSLFQQIFTNALHRAPANSAIRVYVEELHDAIVTSIQIQRASLSEAEKRCLEQNEDLSKAEELGLNLPRKLAEQLGGRLWCEVDVNEDLRICVSLPKAGQHGELTKPPDSGSPP